MNLTLIDHKVSREEKDLGVDDDDRPIIVWRNFHRMFFESNYDIRPHLRYHSCSWDSCHYSAKGDVLVQALLKYIPNKLPSLHGICDVSDDGRKFQFRWR